MLDTAWQAYRTGQYQAARQQAYALPAMTAEAWLLVAACWRAEGRAPESEAAFRHGIALAPAQADLRLNLGNLLRAQNRLPEALSCYQTAIQLAPDAAPCHIALAETLLQANQPAVAEQHIEQAVATGVKHPDLLQALGNARFMQGRHQAALEAYHTARQIAPDSASLLYNSALAHGQLGQREEALACLRQLTRVHPQQTNAWIKLGDLQKEKGELSAAEHSYRQVIALDPTIPEVHNNLGATLIRRGRWQEAAVCYRQALQLGLHDPLIYMNLGNALQSLRELDAALATYRAGLAIAPDYLPLRIEAVHVQQKLCDWNHLEQVRQQVVVPALGWQGEGTPPSPFVFLSLPCEITPAEQQLIARHYAAQFQDIKPLPARVSENQGPVRVGYLSADFHNHATAHLMLGLFQRHDRSRISVHAYSMGPDDGSGYRSRIVADCDSFTDISGLSDQAAAEKIRADGIDILVDLKGYTGSARPAIMAWRPAPVQAQWLGYPGTMGADFIDYILADETVLPAADVDAYSEAPIWLPDCYQVNDNKQPIDQHIPSRNECGLPDEGFVFCCFNSPYKIDQEIFSLWMDLLREVTGSVLWLFAGNPTANDNLREQARTRGIDPQRLVFAPARPKPQHLARHAHADLFLDTLYYNAHTTASDALWSNVPVITLPGRTFASRVAASLLKSVGLPELIVPDLAGYRALALQLAQNPATLREIRHKLAHNKTTMPLFDTDRFARALDQAYIAAWQRHLQGQPPAALKVELS